MELIWHLFLWWNKAREYFTIKHLPWNDESVPSIKISHCRYYIESQSSEVCNTIIYDFIKKALFICRNNKCEISVTNAAKILTLYRYIEHFMKLKAYCTIESMQKCQNLTNYCICISLVVKNVTNTINVEIQLIDWFGNCC